MRVVRIALSLVLIFPSLLPASPRFHRKTQQTSATSSSATTTLQQSLAALVPNLTLTDVRLTGSVRRIAGSDDETGSATLQALSSGAARSDLSLSSGTRSELQNPSATSGMPTGSWSGPDGAVHPMAFHNLLAEPAWFFPAFAVARRLSPGNVIADLGPETRDDQHVEHLSVSQNPPTKSPGPVSFQHLTQLDFFLDSATFLFNIHPDDNSLIDIPLEIRFSDYRSVNGVQVPFHIQKFLNNGLVLDFQVQNATINSGLSASEFAIQ